MKKDDSVCVCGGGGGGGGKRRKKIKKEEEEEERDDNFKIRVKTRRKEGGKNDYDKNMVQIHDEQRSIQMTVLHRDIDTKTLLRQVL